MVNAQPSTAGYVELSREAMLRDWLGLKCTDPTHYGLLGLPELEGDAGAIHHAGRHVKRKLRAYQIGTYRKQALGLLAEVAQAVSVLTNPEKKRAYDRDLFARWRAAIEELRLAHLEGKPRDAAALEAWLAACAARGVPVTRLIGVMVRGLGRRLSEWPPHGTHRLGLPVDLWIYRDAVILGQCLGGGSLERRVKAVKGVQKVLGISEGLARLVAEEVARGRHLFGQFRLVAQARRDPVGILVRLGQRVRRYGGHLGRKGAVLIAVSALLDARKEDLRQAVGRLAELAAEQTLRRRRRRARLRRRWLRYASGPLLDLLAKRPQAILLVVAAVLGLVALVMAFLVAVGVWTPWNEETPPDRTPPAVNSPPASPQGQAPGHGILPPYASSRPDSVEPQWLRGFRQKYPSAQPSDAPPSDAGTAADEPDGPKPATTFFKVPALRGKPSANGGSRGNSK